MSGYDYHLYRIFDHLSIVLKEIMFFDVLFICEYQRVRRQLETAHTAEENNGNCIFRRLLCLVVKSDLASLVGYVSCLQIIISYGVVGRQEKILQSVL